MLGTGLFEKEEGGFCQDLGIGCAVNDFDWVSSPSPIVVVKAFIGIIGSFCFLSIYF